MSNFLETDLYLAIDGGGSSCKARLYAGDSRILAEAVTGPANARLGATRVFGEIMDATRQCLQIAKIDEAELSNCHACFGLAGFESQKDQDLFNQLETPFKSMILETDGVTACIGALDGQDGAVINSGTGTFAVTMKDGEIFNLGGWGFEISDGGSGAILGRHAIRLAVRAYENLDKQTDLTDAILAEYDHDLRNMLAWAEQAEPSDYAKYASMIFDYYEKRDESAIHLVERHMTALIQLIDASMSYGVNQFALLGGLAKRSTPLLPQRLKEKYIEINNDALHGGFLRIQKQLTGSRVTIPQKFNFVTGPKGDDFE